MPESKVRKAAAGKLKAKHQADVEERRRERKLHAPTSRRWVPPTFIVVGLLGVFWLITFYVAADHIAFMSAMGNWNILIGMGLMACAFGLATMWK